MLKFIEHRPEQRRAEADTSQAWMDRQRKKQEKSVRRQRDAERFERKQRMVQRMLGKMTRIED